MEEGSEESVISSPMTADKGLAVNSQSPEIENT